MSKYSSYVLFIFLTLCGLFLSSCAQKVFIVHHPDPIFQDSELITNADVPALYGNQQMNLSKLIVIDAGHGGKDRGAEASSKPPLREKNLNLITARLLESYLQQLGYRTLMTRSEDYFVSLDKRASFANSVGADLFVSVHYNSAPSLKADGIEVFYYRSEINKSRSLASNELADSILKSVILSTKAKSRGVKHGNLAVLRKTLMPAALVEGGFITNPQELAKLRDPNHLKLISWGIAQGIHAYFSM